ncbi:mas-related G-protein coupled receptor member G [Oryctolagus cuniculus]|uniref:mas-related G-protein coupled receptor member G n=1 Tax=Oryctolagus cuniculus TaxID=9986 RepID=UPI00387915BE
MLGLPGIWRTVHAVLFYLTLAVGLGGLLGHAPVLWHLGCRARKGPFNLYLLHLAAADALFLACQVGFSVAQAALGSAQDPLHFAVTFLWFAAGLWLLATFAAERCLSDILPGCYARCRPRHTTAVLCALVWALTLPAVLLPAEACGLLGRRPRPLACLRLHAASIAWLVALAGVACGAGLALFLWVACCSRRPRPRFYGVLLASVLPLPFCGLPFVLYWSLRPLLDFLLPVFPPLAALLACISSSSRPLVYFVVGRQPGKREPLQAVLQRALEEAATLDVGGLSLPMGRV